MTFSSIEIKNFCGKIPQLVEVRNYIEKKYGRIPCCGELSEDCKNVFYRNLIRLLRDEKTEEEMKKQLPNGILEFFLDGVMYVFYL